MEAFVKVAVVVMVVLVIPGFFALLFTSSTYHKLKAARKEMEIADAECRALEPQSAESGIAREKCAAASANYDRTRAAFPNNLVAALFRLPPAGMVAESVEALKR